MKTIAIDDLAHATGGLLTTNPRKWMGPPSPIPEIDPHMVAPRLPQKVPGGALDILPGKVGSLPRTDRA